MIHIYIFTFQKLDTDQGIKRYIHEISNSLLANSNYKITIVTFYTDNHTLEPYLKGNIRMLDIPIPVSDQRGRKLVYYDLKLYNIFCSRVLQKYIIPSENNVFHLNYNQHDLLISHLRKICPSGKIIFTIHFMRWLTAMDYDINRFKKNIYHRFPTELTPKEFLSVNDFWALKSICEEVDKVVCLSEYTHKLLIDLYNVSEKKISIIKNGISESSNSLSVISTSIKNTKSLKNRPIVMIYSGRIEENKGFHLLLNALENICKVRNDVKLIVAGKGNYDKFFSLANRSLGNIFFTGELNSRDLDSLYSVADIGIHPSLNEQCSFSVLEMMRHGLPVIGFDLSGMGELIWDKYNGTKISLKNVPISQQRLEMIESLTTSIMRYLQDPSIIDTEGRNSRVLYENNFSLGAFSTRMSIFYNSLFKSKNQANERNKEN